MVPERVFAILSLSGDFMEGERVRALVRLNDKNVKSLNCIFSKDRHLYQHFSFYNAYLFLQDFNWKFLTTRCKKDSNKTLYYKQ